MSHSRHVLLIAFTASLVTFLSAPQSAPAKHGQDMDYGPVVCHSVTFVQPKNKNAPTWKGAVTRAMVVKLPHGHTLCYDVNRLAVAAYWSGGFLDFGKTHYTSYKGSGPPRPAGKLKYKSLGIPAWTVDGKPVEIRPSQLKGYSLYGDRVVLAYEVGGRLVYELADATEDGVIIRTFQVEGGEKPLSTMIASLDGGKASAGGTTAAIVNGRSRVAVAATGDKAKLQGHSGRVYVDIPASKEPFVVSVAFSVGDEVKVESLAAAAGKARPRPESLLTPGPRRWEKTFTTKGTQAEDDAAYVLDDLPVPEDPYGAWMRPSGIDFFSDGRAAISTLSGDVWIASWKDISEITWQRFATGLYEPLGLKIVDDKVYVRGRDRITRLFDTNNDGEADLYDNFHSAGPIGLVLTHNYVFGWLMVLG